MRFLSSSSPCETGALYRRAATDNDPKYQRKTIKKCPNYYLFFLFISKYLKPTQQERNKNTKIPTLISGCNSIAYIQYATLSGILFSNIA